MNVLNSAQDHLGGTMAIAAENVSKRFEDFVALDDVSISVPRDR